MIMKVGVCAIAKSENNYLREWVEHYRSLGFSSIILYDNNDIDGEHFDTVIGDFIKNGFVTVINVRGQKDIQIKSYDDCYKKYGNNYDWIAFFDIDEFLVLEPNTKIIDFLNKPIFTNFNCIKINWRNFDDNGLIKIENNNYSIQRFTIPTKIDNLVTKCIVRTNVNNCSINSAHGPLSYALASYKHDFSQGNDQFVISCDVNGNPCKNKKDIYTRGEHKVVLNHYRYKTIDEYIKFKTLRGYPEKWAKYGLSFLTIDNFFTYNKLSYKKYKYAKNLLKGHSQFKTRCYLYSILKHYYFKIHNSRLLLLHKIFD